MQPSGPWAPPEAAQPGDGPPPPSPFRASEEAPRGCSCPGAPLDHDDVRVAVEPSRASPGEQHADRAALSVRIEDENAVAVRGRAPAGRAAVPEMRNLAELAGREQLEPRIERDPAGKFRLLPEEPVGERLVREDARGTALSPGRDRVRRAHGKVASVPGLRMSSGGH